MDTGPEVDVHPHHTGHRWLDIALGVSAVAISLMSAVLAFQHGDAMEKMVQQNARMVQANTWPYVSVGDDNTDAKGGSLYRLFLTNSGVGPAKIETLSIRYRGRPVADVFDLAKRVAVDAHDLHPVKVVSSNPTGVLPARQTVTLLDVERPLSSVALVRAFQGEARDQIDVSVCYCSIFDDCWSINAQSPQMQPEPVHQCVGDRKN